MSSKCPQCGAVLPEGETCREFFDRSQSIELGDPGFYSVHHLSVPCYMLQHEVYSARGWLEVRDLLDKFLHQGWTPELARRDNAAASQSRDWSLTKGEKLTGVEDIRWSFTIADVRLDNADHYCADVHRWSESILEDTSGLADMHNG